MKRVIVVLCVFAGIVPAFQAVASQNSQDIKVLGLFKNMAVVNINGQRTVMHTGDTRAGQIHLIAANSEKALFDIRGQRVELSMSDDNSFSTDLPPARIHQAQLLSNGGLYSVTGAVNGQMVGFVLDTGASYVSMSRQQADMLHIDYHQGRQVLMNTANGRSVAYIINVDSVRVGGIELHNVETAVMENLASSRLLLGMSFLNRVEMQHGQGYMVLKQRF